jgi:hypothetical protein
MTLAPTSVYEARRAAPRPAALPDLRDAANRRRDHNPDPERYAKELGVCEYAAQAILEALTDEDGEVLA